MSQKLECDTFWDFLQFSSPCRPSNFYFHSSNDKWKYFDEAKAGFFFFYYSMNEHTT